MSSESYELIAMGLRYWFAALGALVVLRGLMWLMRDRREYLRTLRDLPDAGLIGELVDFSSGESHPLAEEGILGSGHSCDVRIVGLRKRHLEFSFAKGKGVRLRPCHRRSEILVDGRRIAREGYARHGSRILAADKALLIRLFSAESLSASLRLTRGGWEDPPASGPAPGGRMEEGEGADLLPAEAPGSEGAEQLSSGAPEGLFPYGSFEAPFDSSGAPPGAVPFPDGGEDGTAAPQRRRRTRRARYVHED